MIAATDDPERKAELKQDDFNYKTLLRPDEEENRNPVRAALRQQYFANRENKISFMLPHQKRSVNAERSRLILKNPQLGLGDENENLENEFDITAQVLDKTRETQLL